MKDNRKTAKRLLLVNWSCFQNEIISLGSSTLWLSLIYYSKYLLVYGMPEYSFLMAHIPTTDLPAVETETLLSVL